MTSTKNTEQLIKDHCRWLYNQDVRIITFPTDYSPGFDYQSPGFAAIVLPATCTLESLAETGGNKKILLTARCSGVGENDISRESALNKLFIEVQERIGEIMDIDYCGVFSVERASLPVGYQHGASNV
ncbi:hypothetical protein Q9L58_008744 [Maublancomyces gigas]|uniref:Uncharacterized protein n=1 Tax=Discina gigas TaxID=1032678 RepID=A0ABR3G8V0_9PEZI